MTTDPLSHRPIDPSTNRRRAWPIVLLLIAALAFGFYFRFVGLNWDDGEHLHPDERFLTMVSSAIRPPDNLGAYFDSQTSTLNPYNNNFGLFVYGDLPIFITRYAADLLDNLCKTLPQVCLLSNNVPVPYAGYDGVYLLGRILSAIVDLFTLLLMFVIGRRLYNARVGVVAALLGAATVLQIQQSHFYTADIFATFFVVFAFYFIIRFGDSNSWADAIAAGVSSGLAVASRINVLPIVGIVLLAAAAPVLRQWRGPNRASIDGAIMRFVVAVVAGLIVFRIFMPYAFDGLFKFDERWIANMNYSQALNSGDDPGGPPGVQWTDRTVFVFPWINIVFWGMGLPLGLAAWIGWAWAAWQMFVTPYRAHRAGRLIDWLTDVAGSRHLLIWFWVAGYFGYMGSRFVKSIRYEMPIYPFLTLLAAAGLIALWDRMRASRRWLRIASGAAIGLVIVGTYVWAFAFTSIYTQPTTRIAASRWIYDNVPTAATLHYVDSNTNTTRNVQLPLPNTTIFRGPAASQSVGFSVPSNGKLTGITFPKLSDPGNDSSTESIALVVAEDPAGSRTIAKVESSQSFESPDKSGQRFDMTFSPVPLQAGTTYYLLGSTQAQSAALDFSADVVLQSGDSPVVVQAASMMGLPQGVLAFSVPQASTLTAITVTIPSKPAALPAADLLLVKISTDPAGALALAEGKIEIPGGSPAGSYSLTFENIQLQANQQYYLVGEATNGTLVAESSTLSVEHWDDPIPLRLDGRDAYAQYHGVEIQNYNLDSPEKLGQLVGWLDQTDYVLMTSNRLYGSIPRQPLKYPMTTEYYRLMMTGQLGFKLLAEITSYPTIGPITFPDQETTQAMGVWPDPTRCPQSGVVTCRNLINVPMPPAEEAFSVYDHPRVLIFEKTPAYSSQDVLAKLGNVPLREVIDMSPKSETEAHNGLMLPDKVWQAQQQTGTWSDLFDPNAIFNQAPLLGAILWYLAVALLGVIAFPIVFSIAPGLRDRGYGVARIAGLLIVTFVVWFAASYHVIPFTRGTIALAVIALAIVSGSVAWRQRSTLRRFFAESRRVILIEEALFGVAFLWFLFVRFGNPDLWHPAMGGEKPMDFAYLNAVIKSQYFPPYDPWFAGGQITYYYWGFVLVATLIKLLGIVPAIAYNFTIPTLFAMAALGAFCGAFNLVSLFKPKSPIANRQLPTTHHPSPISTYRSRLADPIVVGLIAAIFAAAMGNLGEVQLLSEQMSQLGGTEFKSSIPGVERIVNTTVGLGQMIFEGKDLNFRPEWWYFTPTREIPASQGEAGPISEFPYFTFLYADLHAHMIALPLTLLALALAIGWLTCAPEWSWGGAGSIVVGGIVAGALRATNTWDYPTYLVIGLAALTIGTLTHEPVKLLSTWAHLLVRGVALAGLSIAFFIPFTSNYATAYSSVEWWNGSVTPLWAYLNIHLLFLFPIVTLALWEFKQWGWRWWRRIWKWGRTEWRVILIVAALAVIVASMIAYRVKLEVPVPPDPNAYYDRQIVLVVFPILALIGLLFVRPRLSAAARFWYFVVALAVALTFVVEVVVLKGDISRMNTTFKFYVQVWALLGICAAVALGWLADRLSAWQGWGKMLWSGLMWLLVGASFLYVPLATRGKMLDRFVPTMAPGLDGIMYMTQAAYDDTGHPYDLKWDHDLITWMQQNIKGTPAIIEGNSPLYHWGSRISINTGLPTIIGWDWHQHQQRSVMPPQVIDDRLSDVRSFYDSPDVNAAIRVINLYGIKYVVVGGLERSFYSPDGIAKFDQMVGDGTLRVAYRNDGDVLYEVVR
jgi:YYY domain-containing protein